MWENSEDTRIEEHRVRVRHLRGSKKLPNAQEGTEKVAVQRDSAGSGLAEVRF